jgi:hypothetical protein
MITLEKQIELLAQFSIQYQYRLQEQDEGWYEFFRSHDSAIPLAALIYLKLAEFSKDNLKNMEGAILIRRAFFDLCDTLEIERGRKHLSIQDMFRNSPNDTLAELEEDFISWGQA